MIVVVVVVVIMVVVMVVFMVIMIVMRVMLVGIRRPLGVGWFGSTVCRLRLIRRSTSMTMILRLLLLLWEWSEVWLILLEIAMIKAWGGWGANPRGLGLRSSGTDGETGKCRYEFHRLIS